MCPLWLTQGAIYLIREILHLLHGDISFLQAEASVAQLDCFSPSSIGQRSVAQSVLLFMKKSWLNWSWSWPEPSSLLIKSSSHSTLSVYCGSSSSRLASDWAAGVPRACECHSAGTKSPKLSCRATCTRAMCLWLQFAPCAADARNYCPVTMLVFW